MSRVTENSVPVKIAAKAYGKDPCWIRAGIIAGWLPIGKATRNGREVTDVNEIDSKLGRINYYISPELLYKETGFKWRGGYELTVSEELGNQSTVVSRHRQLELKHWCLQYPEWEKALRLVSLSPSTPLDAMIFKGKGVPSDPTAKAALARNAYEWRMDLLERTAKDACGDNWSFIFESVTKGLSYDDLVQRHEGIPCSKESFDDSYRRFFALLHIRRG